MVPVDELDQVPPRGRRRLVAAGVVVAVAVAALAYGVLEPAPEKRSAAGKAAPEFSLARLDGRGEISSDDLKGSPLVINFWASWCDPCEEEVPRFQHAWEQYEDDGVTILGVALRDTAAHARAFVRKHDVTYPVVVDPDETLAGALDVAGLPQTFFVDSDWRFQAVGEGDEVGNHSGTVVLGAISEKLLNDEIHEMLGARG